MIEKATYELMKNLVDAYEAGERVNTTGPYICRYILTIDNKYNPNFGDNKICKCGHTYYRHFDSYEDMDPVGCKYCGCNHFNLAISEIRQEKLNELGL